MVCSGCHHLRKQFKKKKKKPVGKNLQHWCDSTLGFNVGSVSLKQLCLSSSQNNLLNLLKLLLFSVWAVYIKYELKRTYVLFSNGIFVILFFIFIFEQFSPAV